jgi:PAS domain S-box-containing protein
VLHIDPERVLFPMIQTWPVPSASAETQLVRLEDDHVLYLNRLRHSLAEPMSVRLAMDPSLPAVQAIQNINAWGDGVDYRGVPVIFSSQVVPGTPWIMIAKVDRDEVLSGLRWASVAVGLSVFFLLLIAALLLLNRYRRQEYEQLVALSEQERYFHEVLDHSADAMLIVGSDSQIIYANGQAARLFDYRQEALLSMAWDRLLPRGENSSLDEFYQETVSAGQQTREIRMRTRDKRIIPVELNCAACRTSAGACRFATLPNAAACRTNCVRTKPGSVTFPTVRPTGLGNRCRLLLYLGFGQHLRHCRRAERQPDRPLAPRSAGPVDRQSARPGRGAS